MTYRVLIAEDHPLLRQGLRALLMADSEYSIVGEATDGRDAVLKTVQLLPDLTLMDLSLPGISGIDAVIQIRRRLPQQKVLALGEAETGHQAGDALRAGCLGFVAKDCPQEELMLAIRSVVTGKRFLGQDLAGMLFDGTLGADRPGRDAHVWDLLSSRERTVFKLIAEGRTNRTAADYLNLSSKTVEKHRANLMRKLRINSAVELALLAVDMGIVQRPAMRCRGPELEPGLAA